MSEAVHPRMIDMTGARVHTLQVIRKARKDEKPLLPSATSAAFWVCHCGRCGKIVIKNGSLIRKGTARCDCEVYVGRGRPAKTPSCRPTTNLNDIFGHELPCLVCGELFLLTSNKWAYRVGARYVCSWGCQRRWEQEKEAKSHV